MSLKKNARILAWNTGLKINLDQATNYVTLRILFLTIFKKEEALNWS